MQGAASVGRPAGWEAVHKGCLPKQPQWALPHRHCAWPGLMWALIKFQAAKQSATSRVEVLLMSSLCHTISVLQLTLQFNGAVLCYTNEKWVHPPLPQQR